MSIHMNESNELVNGNTHPVHLVMHQVKLTAPAGANIEWQYPGYISIVLSNGREIAFGESLESESGYAWNCYELDGTNNLWGAFDDLQDIEKIVSELWRQAAPLLDKNCETLNCKNQEMNALERELEFRAGWIGISMYESICIPCFNKIKEENN